MLSCLEYYICLQVYRFKNASQHVYNHNCSNTNGYLPYIEKYHLRIAGGKPGIDWGYHLSSGGQENIHTTYIPFL
jgi:hypothetical protein